MFGVRQGSPRAGVVDIGSTDRLRPLATGVGALAAVAVLGLDDGLVLCPYRRCTGGDCPLCGGTRAAATLLRGDLTGSWARHPLVPILAMQLIVGGVAAAMVRRTGRARNDLRPMLQRFLLVNLALAVGIWVARLASGAAAGPAFLRLPF